MACLVSFPVEIPFGCLMEIISDIRSGPSMATLGKVAAVLGSISAVLGGQTGLAMKDVDLEFPETLDGLAAMLEERLPEESAVMSLGDRWRPDPENVKLILQILIQILSKFLI